MLQQISTWFPIALSGTWCQRKTDTKKRQGGRICSQIIRIGGCRETGTVLISETNQKDFQELCLTERALKKFLILPLTFWRKDPEKPLHALWVMRQAASVCFRHTHKHPTVWKKKKQAGGSGGSLNAKHELSINMFSSHITVERT